jgi:cytochrome d ubiquinol oxidase subunit I
VNYAIKLPGMLSFLVHGNFTGEVKGLNDIPPDYHPPVLVTHLAFQVMVGLGMFLMGVALIYFLALWKKKSWLTSRWLLTLFVAATPLGFIAIEAGWTVTEVGRQPWIIYGVMRTADAVTPMPGIAISFGLFTAIYVSLSVVVVYLLYRQIKMVPQMYDVPEPASLKTS